MPTTDAYGPYPTRDFVCQYGESHYDFFSRWMERAGSYYWFEQDGPSEKMIAADSLIAHAPLPGHEAFRYSPPSRLAAADADRVIKNFTPGVFELTGPVKGEVGYGSKWSFHEMGEKFIAEANTLEGIKERLAGQISELTLEHEKLVGSVNEMAVESSNLAVEVSKLNVSHQYLHGVVTEMAGENNEMVGETLSNIGMSMESRGERILACGSNLATIAEDTKLAGFMEIILLEVEYFKLLAFQEGHRCSWTSVASFYAALSGLLWTVFQAHGLELTGRVGRGS